MKKLLSLLVILSLNSPTKEEKGEFSILPLIEVLKSLGWRRVLIVLPHSNWIGNNELSAWFSASFSNGISCSIVDSSAFEKSLPFIETQLYSGAPYLVFVDPLSQKSNLLSFLNLYRPPLTMMAVVGSDVESEGLLKFLDEEVANVTATNFFQLNLQQSDSKLNRVQTFLDEKGVIREEWPLIVNESRYEESFNLFGHTVRTVALSWMPWLEVGECGEATCKSRGILTDVMNALGDRYNFTWTVNKPEEEKWGSSPSKSDHTVQAWDLEATDFTGVMGETMQRKADVALSVWGTLHMRSYLADFSVPVANLPKGLLINAAMPPLDLTLFIRPFTAKSWFAILGGVALIAITIHLPLLNNSDKVSAKIAVMSSWMFFLLVNAFYGGALTMFFSSLPSRPFEDMDDGLRKHPTWEMVKQTGTTAIMVEKAKQGQKLYQDWLQRAEQEGDLITDFKGVMAKLKEGGYFVETELPNFLSAFNNNPTEGVSLRQVGRTEYRQAVLVLWKNCTLSPMFQQGLSRMWQSGLLDLVYVRHAAQLLGEGGETVEQQTLGPDQTGVIFITFAAAMAAILLCLAAEGIVYGAGQKVSRWRRICPVNSKKMTL